MKPKTFYRLDALLETGRKLAADCETVSFDLFDTLFIRRVHDPDMVKAPVARYIADRAAGRGYRWTWQNVLRRRNRIEQAQRDETGRHHEDHEARYPDFMRRLLAEIFDPEEVEERLREVTDYELAMESAMIVPRARLAAWLSELAADGKRVLVVSDIYLPSTHLRRLLVDQGLASQVTDVVSSADSFEAKASGRAFTRLRQRFGIEPRRWLHVGDNPISDGLRPAEHGIRALVLRDATEKRRKMVAQVHTVLANSRAFWKGRQVQQLMLPLEAENRSRSPLYVEGYNFLAPLIGAFIQEIAAIARKRGLKRIYFFSREGWTFLKFWQRCTPYLYPADSLPEPRYLYVSRKALAGPTCAHQGLTPTHAGIAFLSPGNRDIRDLCNVFRLDIEPLRPFIARHGLQEDTPLSALYADSLQQAQAHLEDLLADDEFQAEVKRQTRPAGRALEAYLEREGFFDQPDVGLVDIGWMGTIQRFLYESVCHRPDCPRFHGLLFAATRGIPYPTTPVNSVQGVIFDRDRFDFAGSLLLYARDVFEEACRAPHATLNGYRAGRDGPELIFRDRSDESGQAEIRQDAHFSPLQQGILDAAVRFGAAAALLGFSTGELKPWINYLLVSKLGFPKTREVDTLRHRVHLDDFCGRHRPPPKALRSQRQLWDRSLRALRWSPGLRLRYYLLHALRLLKS